MWTVERNALGYRLPRVDSIHDTEREAGIAANRAREKFAHLPSIQFDVRYRANRTPLVEWPVEVRGSDQS